MALGSQKTKNDPRQKRGGRSLDRKRSGVDEKKDASDRHEARTAKRLGGEVQRGSGSTERHKGDVKTANFLVENKCRLPSAKDGALSIRVTAKWLEKISGEAKAVGKDPAFAFEIPGIKDPFTEKQWMAVPETVFASLLEELRELRGE